MGDPKLLVWVDAYGEGVGGSWLPGKYALERTFWRLECPKKLLARLIPPTNPEGGPVYKRYIYGRKAYGMARVGRNSCHQKPLV